MQKKVTSAANKTNNYLQKAAKALCFTAGTKVLTNRGFKNIEEIQVGDSVWAYNEATGKKDIQIVEEVFRRTTNQLVQLSIGSEILWTTPDHPFYVNKAWIAARYINVRDSVMLYSDNVAVVKKKAYKDSLVVVYNFTVANYHSYYVSELSILVHNDCEELTKAQKIASKAAQKNAEVFKCKECAADIIKALKKEGLSGEVININTGSSKGMAGNIWSDKAQKVISTNGTHRGILVEGKVFDNLNPNGVKYDDWIKDLHTPTNNLNVTKTKF